MAGKHLLIFLLSYTQFFLFLAHRSSQDEIDQMFDELMSLDSPTSKVVPPAQSPIISAITPSSASSQDRNFAEDEDPNSLDTPKPWNQEIQEKSWEQESEEQTLASFDFDRGVSSYHPEIDLPSLPGVGYKNDVNSKRPLNSSDSNNQKTQWLDKEAIQSHTQINPNRKKIIIIGEYRGGAKFITEFFNQNDQATVIYEPWYVTGQFATPSNDIVDKKDAESKIKILYDFLEKCQYPKFSEYHYSYYDGIVEEIREQEISGAGSHVLKNCVKFDLCFPYKSRSVMESCENFAKFGNIPKKWCQAALDLFPSNKDLESFQQNFQKSCLQKPLTVAKIIRGDDTSILSALQNVDNLSLIYVFRDPRGQLASQLKDAKHWHSNMTQYKEEILETICKHTKQKMDYLKSSKSDWLGGSTNSDDSSTHSYIQKPAKHLHLRYEDMSIYPQYFVKQIYEFIGSQDGLSKLGDTLLKKARGPVNEETLWDNNMIDWSKLSHAGKIAFKWVTEMSFKDVEMVQNKCGEQLLNDLGYRFFKSEGEFDQAVKDYEFTESMYQFLNPRWKFVSANFEILRKIYEQKYMGKEQVPGPQPEKLVKNDPRKTSFASPRLKGGRLLNQDNNKSDSLIKEEAEQANPDNEFQNQDEDYKFTSNNFDDDYEIDEENDDDDDDDDDKIDLETELEKLMLENNDLGVPEF